VRDLQHSDLIAALSYDPDTGAFVWNTRPYLPACWNTRYAGTRAGANSRGYVVIGLFGKLYEAHRLAWFYVTGKMPSGIIDHADRDKGNNRFLNLRECNRRENAVNSGRPSHNTSQFKGITYRKDCRKWQAQIKNHGRTIYLGVFETKESAHTAYCAAGRAMGGEFFCPS